MKIHSDQPPAPDPNRRNQEVAGQPPKGPDCRFSPEPESGEVRFGNRHRSGGRDFQSLVRQLQRRVLETVRIEVVERGPAPFRADGPIVLWRPTGSPPYAAVLTRVAGLARTEPSPPRAHDRPVPPLSAQVLAGICKHDAALLYLLLGDGPDVQLHVGVKASGTSESDAAQKAQAAFESLVTCLAATYADIRLKRLDEPAMYHDLLRRITGMSASLSLVGNPSPNLIGDTARSSADRLIEALSGSRYVYAVEAVPLPDGKLEAAFQQTATEIAEIHQQVKWTANSSTSSLSQESREQIDRFAKQYEELLEIECGKIEAGLREGMWRVSTSLLTADVGELERAGALLRAVHAGQESTPEPVKIVFHSNSAACIGGWKSFRPPAVDSPSASERLDGNALSTALCSSDFGLLVEMPRREAPGFRVTQPRQFAVDVESLRGRRFSLGRVLGRSGPTNRTFDVDLDDLTRHVLIVGVTGAGKTNTAMHLLDNVWSTHQVPFLVIEPAKAQYRHLLSTGRFAELQIFAPGYKDVAPFRLNPFEFPAGIDPQAHITNLYTVFNAAFILYAPMPYVLERALYEVYEERGWDLGIGRHVDEDPRSGETPFLAFPTLTDLYHKVGEVVARLGYEDRIRMDVTAGLQARIDSLRLGQKGQTFDCRRSVPFQAILDKPTIFELSHLGSDEERAFLIGLLLMRLYEHLELAGESPCIKHITLIEEAHRLLSRTSTDTSAAETANVKGKAVEAFCNILAEIRAYGEGLVVAEQIPGKLADDVLKNTNLKVLHRLVAADDRQLMGGTMNLTDDQAAVVTSLRRGEAVAYAEGVESPVLVKVPRVASGGTAADADVSAAAQRFYARYPHILRPMVGCQSCPSVCRFGPAAKRVADRADVRRNVWGYAISCLRQPAAATKGWPVLIQRLLAPLRPGSVRATDREAFASCVCHLAAERAFIELRQRGISLQEVTALLASFAQMCTAVRDRVDDAVARVSQFRAKATRCLQVESDPFPGCEACRAKCHFGPLGAALSGPPDFRERLARAYKDQDPDAAVQHCCEEVAGASLMTTDAEAVRSLARCVYAHVVDRVGARNAAETVERLFGASPRKSP